jgi:DNA-directed RNA polymerase subunit RPC12/RpoP
MRAPGAVARCPRCGSVVFVLVEVAGVPRVHLDGVELVS